MKTPQRTAGPQRETGVGGGRAQKAESPGVSEEHPTVNGILLEGKWAEALATRHAGGPEGSRHCDSSHQPPLSDPAFPKLFWHMNLHTDSPSCTSLTDS